MSVSAVSSLSLTSHEILRPFSEEFQEAVKRENVSEIQALLNKENVRNYLNIIIKELDQTKNIAIKQILLKAIDNNYHELNFTSLHHGECASLLYHAFLLDNNTLGIRLCSVFFYSKYIFFFALRLSLEKRNKEAALKMVNAFSEKDIKEIFLRGDNLIIPFLLEIRPSLNFPPDIEGLFERAIRDNKPALLGVVLPLYLDHFGLNYQWFLLCKRSDIIKEIYATILNVVPARYFNITHITTFDRMKEVGAVSIFVKKMREMLLFHFSRPENFPHPSIMQTDLELVMTHFPDLTVVDDILPNIIESHTKAGISLTPIMGLLHNVSDMEKRATLTKLFSKHMAIK